MLIKDKKYISKEDKIIFPSIFIIILILCNAFLQEHYASDTMILMDIGYATYPSQWFLLDGRIFSALACYTAGILNLPYNIHIIVSCAIGMLLLTIAIFIVYKKITSIMKAINLEEKVLILAISFILILNQFTLEYLLFAEAIVMCLGVLLNVLAAAKMSSNSKNKNLKTLLLLLFAVFCHQGTILIFPVLLLIFNFLDKENHSIKKNAKDLLISFLFVLVVILLNYCVIKFFTRGLVYGEYRDVTEYKFDVRYILTKEFFIYIWSDCAKSLPENFNNIILIVTTFILAVSKNRRELLPQYFITIVVIILETLGMLFILLGGISGRANINIGMFWGMSLIYIFYALKEQKGKNIKNAIIAIIGISFIINSIMLIRNSNLHIASDLCDKIEGQTIKEIIEEYERETGYTVDKSTYVHYETDDNLVTRYTAGMKRIGSLTERKLACVWCLESALKFYCGRDFGYSEIKLEYMDTYLNWIEEMKLRKDTVFREDQILFLENNMFLWIY